MGVLKVERLGGFAGFGGPGSHLRSRGELRLEKLAPGDRRQLDALFERRGGEADPHMRDSFRYRITRITDEGEETVEAPESQVPAIVAGCVRDELD